MTRMPADVHQSLSLKAGSNASGSLEGLVGLAFSLLILMMSNQFMHTNYFNQSFYPTIGLKGEFLG